MYDTILFIHSYLRWLVLLSLLLAIGQAAHGYLTGRTYARADATTRVLATTISHTQLLVGMTLYFVSPIIAYFLANPGQGAATPAISFFAIRHLLTMLLAITVMTIGSSLAKRAQPDRRKFRLTAIYFGLALVLILTAVPWPFLEQAARPWFRSY